MSTMDRMFESWLNQAKGEAQPTPKFTITLGVPKYERIVIRSYTNSRGRFVEVAASNGKNEIVRTFRKARHAKKFAAKIGSELKWVEYQDAILKTSLAEPEVHDTFVDVTIDFDYSASREVPFPVYSPNSLVIENHE